MPLVVPGMSQLLLFQVDHRHQVENRRVPRPVAPSPIRYSCCDDVLDRETSGMQQHALRGLLDGLLRAAKGDADEHGGVGIFGEEDLAVRRIV